MQQLVIRCRLCRRITSVVDVPENINLEQFRLTLNGSLCERCKPKPAQKPQASETRSPMSDP